MSLDKKNIIIVNPSVFSELLLKNNNFVSKYNFLFVYLGHDSIIDSECKFKNCHLILIDDFDSTNTIDSYLSLINHYQVVANKIKNISEVYEQYFDRIPVVKRDSKWIVPKDLVGISFSRHTEFTKRLFDIILIFLFSPVILTLIVFGIILIKITSKGPIFFTQERVGKNGKSFSLFKLRTMIHNTLGHTGHTIANDQRVFPIGKFLRYTKIDELPQCLNVLFGQMSIIGPRPEKIEIVSDLCFENPFYELRHLIRPGITGWAQVNNPTATPNQNFEKLEYDLYYIKNANLFLEFLIIIRTIKIIIKRNSL